VRDELDLDAALERRVDLDLARRHAEVERGGAGGFERPLHLSS
jgi:hypothetical protein